LTPTAQAAITLTLCGMRNVPASCLLVVSDLGRSSDEPMTGIAGFPMPDKPVAGQKKPPCNPKRDEVELNGGCWMEVARRPPCSEGAAEYRGKCYIGVGAAPRAPTSIGP
jgi:hypothetical protein